MPNMLLISGTGRNSGKTTLACSIINRFCKHYPIVAVKITPHMHVAKTSEKTVFADNQIIIEIENTPSSGKDSARMLAAGACQSVFVMAADRHLPEAIEKLFLLSGHDSLIVCESGGLRNYVEPGLFIIVDNPGNMERKPSACKLAPLCDKWVTFDGEMFDFQLSSIEINHMEWSITNHKERL